MARGNDRRAAVLVGLLMVLSIGVTADAATCAMLACSRQATPASSDARPATVASWINALTESARRLYGRHLGAQRLHSPVSQDHARSLATPPSVVDPPNLIGRDGAYLLLDLPPPQA